MSFRHHQGQGHIVGVDGLVVDVGFVEDLAVDDDIARVIVDVDDLALGRDDALDDVLVVCVLLRDDDDVAVVGIGVLHLGQEDPVAGVERRLHGLAHDTGEPVEEREQDGGHDGGHHEDADELIGELEALAAGRLLDDRFGVGRDFRVGLRFDLLEFCIEGKFFLDRCFFDGFDGFDRLVIFFFRLSKVFCQALFLEQTHISFLRIRKMHQYFSKDAVGIHKPHFIGAGV